MKLFKILRNTFSKKITVIFIPHSPGKTLKLHFSFSFLLFIIICWTCFTIWAGYVNTRHIDYWKLRLSSELTKMKLTFFANRIRETQEYMEKVRERDAQLRELLEMGTKKAIITESGGTGGPTSEDKIYFQKLLSEKINELTVHNLNYQVKTLKEESEQIIKSVNEIDSYIQQQKQLYLATPNMWPTYGRITSGFGFRLHPITRAYEYHTGIDISNHQKTPIFATAPGIVEFTGWTPGYGKSVVIEHGYGFKTIYGHCHEIFVRKNQKVNRGQKIATMGDTGTSTGVHLHYEILYNGKSVNPKFYLDKDSFFVRKNRY